MNSSTPINTFKRYSAGTIAALFVAVQLPLFLLASPNVSAAPKNEPKNQSSQNSAQPEVQPIVSIDEMMTINSNRPSTTPAAQNGDPGNSGNTPSADTDQTPTTDDPELENTTDNGQPAASTTPAAQNGDPGNSGNTPSADTTPVIVATPTQENEVVNNNGNNSQSPENTNQSPNNSSNDKITICHATSSSTNPAVLIYVSDNARGAHFEDNGTAKAGHEADILNPAGNTCPVVAVETIEDIDEEIIIENTNPINTGTTNNGNGRVLGASIVRNQSATPVSADTLVTLTSAKTQSNFMPQVLGASTSKQLVNTGDSAITSLIVGMLIIGSAVIMANSRRHQTV